MGLLSGCDLLLLENPHLFWNHFDIRFRRGRPVVTIPDNTLSILFVGLKAGLGFFLNVEAYILMDCLLHPHQ